MRRGALVVAASLAGIVAGSQAGAGTTAKLTLRSPAFAAGGAVPAKHTCDGDNVSPPLTWTAPPKGTKSLALVLDDPDAPGGRFTHWLVWGLAPKAGRLAQGAAPLAQGSNDAGRTGYLGPCPPPGPAHRYVFTLHALKVKLSLAKGATRKQFDAAIRRKSLAVARLTGTYGKASGKFELTSTAFAAGAPIPAKYSCENPSPPLAWGSPPAGTQSLALYVFDPDAGDFPHWLGWSLSTGTRSLAEGAKLPVEGIPYFGPCPPPPDGPHRYVFRLYALSAPALDLVPPAAGRFLNPALFLAAVEGKVVAVAELAGTFDR